MSILIHNYLSKEPIVVQCYYITYWDYFIELINLNSHSLFKIDSHGVRRALYTVNEESVGLTGAVTISQYDSALSDGCTIHQVLISVIKICHSRIYDNLFIQELPRTLVTI